ncbi:MAG TPA: hypothetical protein VIX80_08860 [Candidatus Kapabacteria bacterium]
MSTKIFSFIGLIALVLLAVLALPNYVSSFSTNPSASSILMSGLVVLLILVGAILLLLFGVIGLKGPSSKK